MVPSTQSVEGPAAILVPCQESGSLGCEIVRRAVGLVAAATPEVTVMAPDLSPRGSHSFVVAVDGSSSCQASMALRRWGVRPGAVVSAPAVLARTGLLRPGGDVRARVGELTQTLAAAISKALEGALEEARRRRHYREQMTSVLERFQGIWTKVEALPSPDGPAPLAESAPIELLAKRARNLFVKFDEIVPPAAWAEPHDLFQDALLCIAYACEGWIAGDAARWEQNLEKARLQIRPLLRRLV